MTFHIAQETLAPEADLPKDLYLRLRSKAGLPILVATPTADGQLSQEMRRGDTLSTDTFFGSFYRSYWDAYAPLDNLALTIALTGRAQISVIEDTGHGLQQILCQELEATEELATFTLPLPALPSTSASDILITQTASRLFVEIQAISDACVTRLDFVTQTAPRRETTLSVGLCTFNQETYFAKTLARVTALAERTPALRRIYVVNQGKPFASDAIQSLLSDDKVTAISQRNLGGCGGFTRSLDEALKTNATSHHLMMDDDIVLDARLIARAIRFMDFTRDDVALGAGMLDAMRPTVMYEAGAFLRRENRIEAYCHNVNMAEPGQLHHFNRPARTDYNAWWFCMIPLSTAAKIELPAPIFIRGDDFEYGQRLARAGVPTVTLPGIAVWHEPFYAKPSGWQDYYDLRNRLIFGATYGDKVRQLSLAHVLGLITNAMLTHNYMAAELRIRAVEDFLKGPKALFATDPEDTHMDVMALAKAHAPEKLDNSDWKSEPGNPGRYKRPEPRMRKLIAHSALSLLRSLFGPHRTSGRHVLMDHDAHIRNTAGRAYVLTNGPRSYHLQFTPDRKKLRDLCKRVAKLAQRYRAESPDLNHKWADEIANYRKADWWTPVFAAGSEAHTSAASVAPQTNSQSAPDQHRAKEPA